jgi:aldehyde dehydrogenase (NAD+)
VRVLAEGRWRPARHADGFYVTPKLLGRCRRISPWRRTRFSARFWWCSRSRARPKPWRLANGTDYGLVAGVWTSGWRAPDAHGAEAPKCRQVFINNYGAAGGVELPFGGYKRSGFGREKGIEGLKSFTVLKTIAVRHD